MTHPGSDTAAGQPGTPEAPWTPPQSGQPYQPQGEEKKGSARKWVSLAGTVVVAGVGGAYYLTGGFGIGDPKVDDCVHLKSAEDWEVVDCGSGNADAKVVGIESEKLTEDEFMADPASCAEFATAEGALWFQNGMITEKGTVYCIAAI